MSAGLPQPFPQGSNLIASLPTVGVSFDVPAFDRVLRSQGVRMRHMRAFRCPIGLTDKNSYRAPGHDDLDHGSLRCRNGFLYKEAGIVTAPLIGNSTQSNSTDLGIIDGSTVQTTLPLFYDDSENPIAVSVFDQLILADKTDLTVVNWETFESSPKGIDKLHYPAKVIEHIIDAKGNEYEEGKDFSLVDGTIVWGKGNAPSFNPTLGKGTVLAARYRYIPWFYVAQLIHEVRVVQNENRYTGERAAVRMPYQVVLKRENVFEDEQKKLAENIEGQVLDVPSTPSFGSR